MGLFWDDMVEAHKYKNIEHFDQQLWDEDVYSRSYMTDALLEEYDLLQMNKDEIVELLGENHVAFYGNSCRYSTKGGFIRDEILFVDFDEYGNVTNYGFCN